MRNFLVTFEVSCPDGLLAVINVAMKANVETEAVTAARLLVAPMASFKSVVEVK